MDCEAKAEELLGRERYLIDIFPDRVPEKADGRYFGAERILREDMADFGRKIRNIVLKLYCYCDMTAVSEEGTEINPPAELLADMVGRCYSTGEGTGYLHIILPEHDSMLVINRGDLYAELCAPDERLKKLVADLARAEGLFFVRAETQD